MTAVSSLRHLDHGPTATVDDLGAAGIQALMDGYDVGDWRPLLLALQQDPWGPVARRVERVLPHLETYGTASAIGGWLLLCRAGRDHQACALAQLRRDAGLSQRQLAARIGVSQAQIARLEVAKSPSMRSLTRYLAGLDMAPVALVASANDGAKLVRLTPPET